ncbi:MAG TPA: HAD-IB family phosphatase [Myxococcales bacterium]|nr:HAD-IB family phosphatase [Myxococcales bacterium]
MTDLAVVCDFDGTATLLDVGDEISRHFCGAEYLALQKKLFHEGKLTTRAIIQSIYTPIRAGEAEVLAFALQAAKLRAGFADLVAAARDRGAPFYLASGGLRQYVEAVIAAHLPAELRAHVQVRANEAVFSPSGLRVTYPGDAESRAAGCEVCGSCKRVAVAEARRAGASYVLGIGDGFADRCLAKFADRTFVREDSYLHHYCRDHGLDCTPFTDLHEAAEAVRGFVRPAATPIPGR